MMRSSFLLAIVCALPGCGGGCNSPSPSSETCEPGAPRGVVTGVDIGRYLDGTFTEYQDGDIAPLVYGGQGFPMIVLNLRLRGSDLPGCMPQVTRLFGDNGELEGSEELPLVTDQVLPDTWITGDLLIVSFDAYSGDFVTAESMVGSVTTATGLWIDYVGTLPDAAVAVDARPPDARPPDAAP